METLIVCRSVSHGNTRRVAEAMAEVLDARVVEPGDVTADDLASADLVGVGSGIYGMAFHREIRAFVDGLPWVTGKQAFVFSTSGSRELPWFPYARRLGERLEGKGFDVVGSFSCRGWDTWLPLRLVGGLNKGHPDAADLERARRFAADLGDRVGRS